MNDEMLDNDNKMKIMSLAVEPEFQTDIKSYAKKKGMSVSAYVRSVMKKALKLKLEDDPLVVGVPARENVTPVVLLIPKNLKEQPDQLRTWLDDQVSGLVRNFGG